MTVHPHLIWIIAIATSALVVWALCGVAKDCGWAHCPDCDTWHHPNGRMSFGAPPHCADDWDGVKKVRVCDDCIRKEAIRKADLKQISPAQPEN